jgi:hypothetical protein
MGPDTSRTVEIEGSPAKLAILLVCGVVMTAVSVALLFIPDYRDDWFVRSIGYFGAGFFTLCTLIAVVRLWRARAPVVTISPQGIRDTRVAADTIPWRAIGRISTWSYQGQSAMVLAVDPAVERGLKLTTIARWTRKANAALGADGLCVSASGLKIDYATLLATAQAYARQHGGAA